MPQEVISAMRESQVARSAVDKRESQVARSAVDKRESASKLYAEIYTELHRQAHHLRTRFASQTLNTTSLVHEAIIKVIDAKTVHANREHLFRLTALAMRQILLNQFRDQSTVKRGGEHKRVDLSELESLAAQDMNLDFTHAVRGAIARLQSLNTRMSDIFLLRSFAGFTLHDIASMLAISHTTVHKEFEAARAYLKSVLSDSVEMTPASTRA
jgi:RNA polymerase sigma-70 factor, ECF subfamily